MYLSEAKRKDIMTSYGYENATEIKHYEVGPDTWIYLFEINKRKYILVSTDYAGDYEFDIFPHLLKYEDNGLEFVLQREIPVKDGFSKKQTLGTLLFEYTD